MLLFINLHADVQENNTRIDKYLLGEPALSLLIEDTDKKILFDTGYSDIFLKNAKALNINLDGITDIVISHSHNDHSGGLRYLQTNKNILLTAHPNIFDKKIDKYGSNYGCPIKQNELEKRFCLNLTKTPYFLTENLLFLGEIENNQSQDIDDSALVYTKDDSAFIITGCAHAGIINIINYAKKVTKANKIAGVLGGMHLTDKSSNEIEEISNFFKEEKIGYIAPCHCCDLNSKIILSKSNNLEEICVGDTIEVSL